MQRKKSNLIKIALSKLFEHGLSSIIFAITLLALLLIINYVFMVKTSYIDITKDKIYSLSDQTKSLLHKINYKVDIKAFYLLRNQYRISRLLDLYRQENDNISYEVIDPIKNPIIAEEYEVGDSPRTIIFESPTKTSRLKTPPPGRFNKEPEITMAFYRHMSEQTNTVYFTEGHGEMSLFNTRQGGLSILYDRLIEQNYLVETINLQTVTEIPSDCSVLIIVGPRNPFIDVEKEVIRKYRAIGGKFLILISPGAIHDLDFILDVNNVEFGDDFVYETASDRTTQFGPTAPICSIQDPSEITSNLENQSLLFPVVRSVNIISPNSDLTMIRLFASSENSWAESIESAVELEEGKRPVRDENEKKGPITVAMATESRIIIPDSGVVTGYSESTVRSAFLGSAGFATNAIVSTFPANLSLFLNTVNWITRNENVFDLTTHFVKFTPVELTRKERRMISWLSLFVFPFTIMIVGLFVWFRKR